MKIKKHESPSASVASQIKDVPAQNRIVIGDVGSGKTMVGFFVALGFLHGLNDSTRHAQVAIVAPTEILASQHYENFLTLLSNAENSGLIEKSVTAVYAGGKKYRINDEFYTKSVFEKKLKEFLGLSHLVWLGTHALFHRSDVLPELVMIDEQHRFGVNQRRELTTRLSEVGKHAHFISFSATPIPRTVALTVYRDLKPLFLESLKRKSTIHTRICNFESIPQDVLPFIHNALENNQKVYIVCPRIEDEEASELWSIAKAQEYFEKKFGDLVITLHGKQKDKDKTIEMFRDSADKHILVSTSVIEVGVDIAAATVMVILNAERFGLAALHQIRGRIGRNNIDSNYCFLVASEQGVYSKRLRYLTQSQDGFWLAQKDLELRGAGDMTGKLQSGYTEDIEIFMNAEEEDIANITELVQQLPWDTLPTDLPRLQSYLESQMEEHWNE